jgi:2-dehydro-3-deoxyglucarate aldolase/4-hydroxy-2-oxoheptanedioate aldolase
VRVADLQYGLVARALDCGAEGVIFPRVESVELLERAVSWTKFPPVGIRGCGVWAMHVNYDPLTLPQMIERINEDTLVVLQIETVQALEMRDELLSIKGIDVVLIGPVDLSISLGVPGDFMHPKVIDAMEKIRDSCVAHGIIPGTQTRNEPLAKFWRDRGMLFLGCNSEFGMLMDRAFELSKSLKQSAVPA